MSVVFVTNVVFILLWINNSPYHIYIESDSWWGVRDSTLCDKSMSVTCDKSVIFSGHYGFSIKTDRNIVESGVKHHNLNPYQIWFKLIYYGWQNMAKTVE
jgi:hypothetical protein